MGEPPPADRIDQRTTPGPTPAPRSDEHKVLPAWGDDVEQPVARAEHEADGDPVELASYVPALVVRRFADRHEPLAEAETEQFLAAVLFADISGFTVLTERLAGTGPGGVEALTELLNDCFGELVGLVGEHGGEVVKFAGDALLAIWPMDDDKSGVTAWTARCGLAMQQSLHGREFAAGAQLSVRIAVGSGQLSVAHLGGVRGRWEVVVGGPAVAQVCAAEQVARPGDVVLSPEASDLLGDLALGEQMRLGADGPSAFRLAGVRLPTGTAPLVRAGTVQAAGPALRGYVPAAVTARLAAGQSAWISELRTVSVLFVRLPGLDDISSDSLEQAQQLVDAVQETLYEYEGSVNKLGVDDKGATLVAAFGLPPVAHEDDAVRAVQAALEIQAKLQRLGLRLALDNAGVPSATQILPELQQLAGATSLPWWSAGHRGPRKGAGTIPPDAVVGREGEYTWLLESADQHTTRPPLIHSS